MRSGLCLLLLSLSVCFCHLRPAVRRTVALRALMDVSAAELEAAVRGGGPVVLDVHAVWCGPCKFLEPALRRLAQELRSAQVLRLDSDLESRKATELQVEGLPTVIFFHGGQV